GLFSIQIRATSSVSPREEALQRGDYKGKHLNKLVDSGSIVPGRLEEHFRSFQNILLLQDAVYFVATTSDSNGSSSWGFYRFADGKITRIADRAPASTGEGFSGFLMGGDDTFLFATTLGVFSIDLAGKISQIINQSAMPGSSSGALFNDFRLPISGEGRVVFLAGTHGPTTGGPVGLYEWDGSRVTSLLGQGDILPDSQTFTEFDRISGVDFDGNVVTVSLSFASGFYPRTAIYVIGANSILTKTAATGDRIPGTTLSFSYVGSLPNIVGESLFFGGATFDFRSFLVHSGPNGLETVAEMPAGLSGRGAIPNFIVTGLAQAILMTKESSGYRRIDLWDHGTRSTILPASSFFQDYFYLAAADSNNLVVGFEDSALYSTLPRLLEPPVIVQQPSDRTIVAGSLNPVFGQSVFSVPAKGIEPMTYQWQKDGLPLGGKTNFSLIIGTGSTNDTGVYTVVISNQDGTVTSDPARLTVVPPQPATLFGNPLLEIGPPQISFFSLAQIAAVDEIAARHGVIAFENASNVYTVYRYESGEWRIVVESGTALSGGVGKLETMSGISVGDDGEILFVAATSAGSPNLYEVTADAVISRILETTNPIVTFPFRSSRRPLRRNGRTVFLGSEIEPVEPNRRPPATDGLFAWDGTNLTPLVTRKTITPAGAQNLTITSFDFDGQNLLFAAAVDGQLAYYRLGGGQLAKLIEAGAEIAGSGLILQNGRGFWPSSIKGQRSAFVALAGKEKLGNIEVLIEVGEAGLNLIAQAGQVVPDLGRISQFRNVKVLDSQHIVFGCWAEFGGVALWDGKRIISVVSRKNSIGDGTIDYSSLVDADERNVWISFNTPMFHGAFAVASRQNQTPLRLDYRWSNPGFELLWQGPHQLQYSRDLREWIDDFEPVKVGLQADPAKFFRLRSFP
ncbi:MAG: immunoglobulin domain-containing protein, partial [Verrucomicrobiales bacterium]|nr:immunoglobulin domain-containing protein [Verrucomicrobiales bacterium]